MAKGYVEAMRDVLSKDVKNRVIIAKIEIII
jgi:hypothetical protein